MKKYTHSIKQKPYAIHIKNSNKQPYISKLFGIYPHINNVSSNNNF